MKRFNLVLFKILFAFSLAFGASYYLHKAANTLFNAGIVKYYGYRTQENRGNTILPAPVCQGVHYQLLPSYSSLYYAPHDLAGDSRKKILFMGDSHVDYALWLNAGSLMPSQNPVFSIPVGGISICDMLTLLDIYDRYYNVFAVRNVVVLGLTFVNFDQSADRQETIFNFNNRLPLAKTYEMSGDDVCRRKALFPVSFMLNEIHIFYTTLYLTAHEIISGSSREGNLPGRIQATTAYFENRAGMMSEGSWKSFAALVSFLQERHQRVVVIALPVRRAINTFSLQARFKERIESCARQRGFDYIDRSSFLAEDEFYSDTVFYYNYPGRVSFTAAFADDMKNILRKDERDGKNNGDNDR